MRKIYGPDYFLGTAQDRFEGRLRHSLYHRIMAAIQCLPTKDHQRFDDGIPEIRLKRANPEG